MAERLTKIYTRSGDQGLTRLATGERIAKTHARIAAFGDLDETNSAIGMILCADGVPENTRRMLTAVQQDLFDMGADLAVPGSQRASDSQVARLERELDAINATLPPLKEFVLPGGGSAAAACHLARAIARRAERSAWRLAEETEVNAALLRYLNRLSDLLFVVARALARRGSPDEPLWEPDRAPR